MQITKLGRKWVITGEGEGWIFGRIFPRKFKAKIALGVFANAGTVKDYRKQCREYLEERRPVEPVQKIRALKESLIAIQDLSPTCEEIVEFARECPHGVVTITKDDSYFGPRFHNTWGVKYGGRMHIDIGCQGYHLMLDEFEARRFVNFIRTKRKPSS